MTVHRDRYAEIDVSGWEPAHEETLGTKPKRWLRDPDTRTYWLMKDGTFNRRRDGSMHQKGDDWAERIASEVARLLELPAAHVELATGGPGAQTALGVISRSIRDEDETLIHGNELLAEIGVAGDDPHDRTGYTLASVHGVLSRIGPPDGAGDLTAWEAFVGFLVLDALIGNTDRHQENWAALGRGRDRRLAPTFDHASSLGFQLDDEQRQERLVTADRNRTPEAYADRARSRFERHPSPLQVAITALEELPVARRDLWLERCADIEQLVATVDGVPQQRMSRPAREFAERMLRRNHTRLLSHPFGTV